MQGMGDMMVSLKLYKMYARDESWKKRIKRLMTIIDSMIESKLDSDDVSSITTTNNGTNTEDASSWYAGNEQYDATDDGRLRFKSNAKHDETDGFWWYTKNGKSTIRLLHP
ncbi:hypothetical protein F8M41_017224 [Gigaspora margarita]|uniref:Uncharacterized protein n=1 Tax=Gigaspora margarita TaxID=4874 RepID=A0A8H4ANC5_GIGMA|nr:hypothetical protein F8M41_017224 [Gigaspora margarita]